MTRGTPWPGATTRLVVLLGWPARHSLSPVIHNAAFAEHELDMVYLALPTPPEELGRVVAALGAVGAIGANVTVPHKQQVLALCDQLTVEAEAVGAVNTLTWTTDGLVGDNTDASGLERVLRDDLGAGPDTAVTLLGTGGAARAAMLALGRVGCAVTVVGRRPAAAQTLADLAATHGAAGVEAVDLDDTDRVASNVAAADVVINATPLGMSDEALPAPFMTLRPGQTAYDLVYSPADTPFLVAAREAGATAHHGLGMLVAQAALSYRRWTGREAPVGTMSAVALSRLSAGSHAGEAPAT